MTDSNREFTTRRAGTGTRPYGTGGRWAPLASTVYHDWYWYPLKGKQKVAEFMESDWGKLFAKYRQSGAR